MTSIDLRPDTVTRPSPAMRQATKDAEVGGTEYDDHENARNRIARG